MTEPKRVFMAGISAETNTFSPMPIGLASYADLDLYHGDCSRRDGFSSPIVKTWRAQAEALGWEVVESLIAVAPPGGRTLRHVYESFRAEIVEDSQRKGPFDIALLSLHGAMAAEGYDDCEGDLIHALRDVVGRGCIIGGELDPHCHLTRTMLDGADVLIAYKEYPHTDIVERADELFAICRDAALGKVRPTSFLFDCRMVGIYPTTSQPMIDFVKRLKKFETRPNVLSVSFGHGFAWGDVPESGSKLLAITNDDAELARGIATELGLELYRMRERLIPPMVSIDEGLAEAARSGVPVVMADTSDNAGGGAPADNTAILRAMVAKPCGRAVIGIFWDPQAVSFCAEAGVGAEFELRIGGKIGRASGEPIDLRVKVISVREDHEQTGLTGPIPFGRSACVRAGAIDIVMSTLRRQTFSPDAFTGLGLELADYRLIVVKSTQHFRMSFSQLGANIIYVRGPGALDMNLANLPYEHRSLDYWPRVADPLKLDAG